ncbi:hypothetical protein [Prosthecomicrobium sp. N25]|uniref:hypothetical protein n=1 Tax=Prosthecomicrobium sp. N25 TaxID=3129254 RepID=UPI003077F7C1
MSTLGTTTKLYLRVAYLRRRVLLREALLRSALAVVAGILLVVGLGLLDYAVFLALRERLGDVSAALAIGAAHILAAVLLAILAFRDHVSPESAALAEAEAAALDAVAAEAEGLMQGLAKVERAVERLGGNLSTGFAAVSALTGLLGRSREKS